MLKGRLARVTRRSVLVLSLLGLLSSSVVMPMQQAAALSTQPPKISFTFDDGYQSALGKAAPTLQKYGIKGTDYVITNCASGVKPCPLTAKQAMNWTQILQLRNTYGWEIGSHTKSHPLMSTLTAAQQETQLSGSKQALADHGIDATAFATPYGDYNMTTLALAAKYYTSHRGFADTGYNAYPYDDYLIRDQQVQGGVSVAKVKGYINSAVQNHTWLVLTFHQILDKPSTDPNDYQYGTQQLDQIAAYVKSLGLAAPTVSKGLATGTTNLMPNTTFNNGIADGWTTDDPTHITASAAGNGNFPDPAKTAHLASGTTGGDTHLFSPKVAVTTGSNYVFKTYLNVHAISSGVVGFYFDEYDSNGNWVSGYYAAQEGSVFVENINLTYSPTAPNVASVSLQVIVGGQGIDADIDNVQMFNQ